MVRIKHLSATLVLALLLLVGSLVAAELRGDKEQARGGWDRIEQGSLVIDVRSTEEFESGHLPGAINVPYTNTDALAQAIGPNKQREVVLYCGSGRRVGIAMEALEELGYQQLYNATGLDALLATQPKNP